MIFKFVLVCTLLAVPVLGSAIKGHPAREVAETKGGNFRPAYLAPVEQQKLIVAAEQAPTKSKLEHVVEQKEEFQQQAEQKIEEFQQQQQQQKQEVVVAETKGRYEARPQVSREELKKELPTKTNQRQEQQVAPVEQQKELLTHTKTNKQYEQQQPAAVVEQQKELTKSTRYEQRQEAAAAPVEQKELSKVRYEQKQQEETRYVEQQRDYADSQQQQLQVELKEEEQQQRHYEEPAASFSQQQEERYEQQQVVYQAPTKGGAAAAPLAEAEPYAFSYQVEGSTRREEGDTKGTVRGQYTLQGADGSSRVVDYVADHNGFRASVSTNEFGTESKSPAGVALRTSQPLAEDITLRLDGKTREDFAAPLAPALAGVKGAAVPVAAAPVPAVPAKPENWSVKSALPLAPQSPQAPQEEIKGSPLNTKRIHQQQFQQQREEIITREQAPAKGQRLIQQQQQQQQEELQVQQQQQQQEPQEPIKSAELIRAPKALANGEVKLAQAANSQVRAGFESATAHRAVYRTPAQAGAIVSPTSYAAPVPVPAPLPLPLPAPIAPVAGNPVAAAPIRSIAPGVLVRAQSQSSSSSSPVIRSPVPAVSRTYLQRERYPPSPVQGHYRPRIEQPAHNPRISFYSSNSPPVASSSSASFDDDQPSGFEQPDSS